MKYTQEILDICQILQDKKAEDIVVVNTTKVSNVAKYFIIVTATSIAHTKTLADYLESELAKTNTFKVINREGFNYSEWIVLDLDEILVHIFTKQKREYYNLDKLVSEGNNTKSYDKIKKSIFKQEKDLNEKNKIAKIKAEKLQKKEEEKLVKKQSKIKKDNAKKEKIKKDSAKKDKVKKEKTKKISKKSEKIQNK